MCVYTLYTFPLLHAQVIEAEHGEEAFLGLQLRAVVHLLRSKASAKRRRQTLAGHSRRRRASFPEHPPPLPPLMLQQLFSSRHGGQTEHPQKVQLLQPE